MIEQQTPEENRIVCTIERFPVVTSKHAQVNLGEGEKGDEPGSESGDPGSEGSTNA